MPITGYPAPPPGVDNNAHEERGWGTGWPNCQYNMQRWIYLSNKVGLQIRKEISELLRLVLNECIRRGYNIRDADSACFVCRPIADTEVPSSHSWGLSPDINWQSNPMGTHTTNIPHWMVELMWSYHFYWGGWYNSPDPMHFEYVGTPAQAIADTTRAIKAFGGSEVAEKVELVDKTNNALIQMFQSMEAERDGSRVDAGGGYAGGEHWMVKKLTEIASGITTLTTAVRSLQTSVDALTAVGTADAVLIKNVVTEVLQSVRYTVDQ